MNETPLLVHCLVLRSRSDSDPRAHSILADAIALGLTDLKGLKFHKLYFVERELSKQDLQRLAGELLSVPVTETYGWRTDNGVEQENGRAHTIEIGLRPGVTDPAAEQIVRSAQLMGIEDLKRAATGQRYVLDSHDRLGPDDLDTLARRLLANPTNKSRSRYASLGRPAST